MSRSGYTCDDDDNQLCLWRGRVASATRGQRGQAFFRALVDALDAMPVKELIAEEIASPDGVCTLGALIALRKPDGTYIDPEDHEYIGGVLNIAPCLVQEVEYENDEAGPWRRNETPAERWTRMRAWAEKQITKEPPHA